MTSSKPRQARGKSIRDRAYLYVRNRIRSGTFGAGTFLSEAEIARTLGISRTPLREAIRQLVAEGFLRQNPNGVSVVVEFSKRDITELYELREALEVYAAGKAAEQAVRSCDLEALQQLNSGILVLQTELVQSAEDRLNAEQMQRFLKIDLEFHATLVRAAANLRILKAFADTRVLLSVFAIRRKGHHAAQLGEILRYHSEILDAVARGNSLEAMRVLRDHIRISRQERLSEYDERERERLFSHPIGGIRKP